jgi:hypothetical protein
VGIVGFHMVVLCGRISIYIYIYIYTYNIIFQFLKNDYKFDYKIQGWNSIDEIINGHVGVDHVVFAKKFEEELNNFG